jgi:benzoyl-CoA reductase subunit BamC
MKKLRVEARKCTGCRTCEVICSLMHNKGLINPRLARVRVYRDDTEGIFSPIFAAPRLSIEYADNPQFFLGEKKGDFYMLSSVLRYPARQCTLCGSCARWCVTGAIALREDHDG